jgi:hypothetical protein
MTRNRCPSRRPILEELESRLLPSVSVLTYHNDNAGTGQNLSETNLTTSNVNANTFGKLFTTSLDGQVYAQPLVMPGVNITTGPNQGTHDVVFVATEHDSLYAIDADNGQVLWQDSFLTGLTGATVTSVPAGDVQYPGYAIDPEIGITGTPVIDPATNTLYVVAFTKEVFAGDVPHYIQRLHAVNLSDGSEKFGGPITIADTQYDGNAYTLDSGPSVSGTGDGADSSGTIVFNVARELQRSALTLAGGRVYVDYASYSDHPPYHGWILGYDASTLQLDAVFNDTPNGTAGGVWESGGGLAVDSSGALYFESGNGTFDTTLDSNGFPVNADYGDSFVKLVVDPNSTADNPNANGWGLKVVDYFTPYNQDDLQQQDHDLGSGGPLILPDSVGNSAHPHLLIGASKEGTIYLIDRDNMGQFTPGGPDNVVQSLVAIIGPAFDTPAYYQNTLYFVGQGDVAQTFTIADGSAQITTPSTSQSSDSFGARGSTPSISANGSSNGIAWDLNVGSNELRAYDATSYATELYTSDQAAGGRDAVGTIQHFSVPTVANGLVYVGTDSTLVIYGLFSAAPPAAPSALTASSAGAAEIDLTWAPNSTNQTGFEVQRATDRGFIQNVTTVAITAANVTNYADTGLSASTTYYYRVLATNGNGDSADSNTASATILPAGWAAKDIGSPGQAGTSSFDGTTWTVQGGGSDIWSAPDQFQYAYQSVNGDATIIADITSVSDSNAWAKAGVMFRDGTDAGASYVAVFENPNGQVEMQWRDAAGSDSDWNGSQVGDTGGPKWVKIVRSGDTFTAYYAETTGTPMDSDWIAIGSRTVTMSSATAGLAVTAGDNTALCTSTFTNVSIGAVA